MVRWLWDMKTNIVIGTSPNRKRANIRVYATTLCCFKQITPNSIFLGPIFPSLWMPKTRLTIGHNPWFRFSRKIRNVMFPGCSHKTGHGSIGEISRLVGYIYCKENTPSVVNKIHKINHGNIFHLQAMNLLKSFSCCL